MANKHTHTPQHIYYTKSGLNSFPTLAKRLSPISKPLLKCHSMIGVKIFCIVTSSNVSMLIRLKWRRKRCVTWLRPPPGGPIAASMMMSSRYRILVSFLEKIPRERWHVNAQLWVLSGIFHEKKIVKQRKHRCFSRDNSNTLFYISRALSRNKPV